MPFGAGIVLLRQILGQWWAKYPLSILFVVATVFASPSTLCALTAKKYFAEMFVTPSPSMSPTLSPGDRFVVHKRLVPRRWDVIVYTSPQTRQMACSRVIGLPGERVELINGVVTINGAALPWPGTLGPNKLAAPALYQLVGVQGHPITLAPDEYYVLGDNGTVAFDSRYWETPAPGHQVSALPRGKRYRRRHLDLLARPRNIGRIQVAPDQTSHTRLRSNLGGLMAT